MRIFTFPEAWIFPSHAVLFLPSPSSLKAGRVQSSRGRLFILSDLHTRTADLCINPPHGTLGVNPRGPSARAGCAPIGAAAPRCCMRPLAAVLQPPSPWIRFRRSPRSEAILAFALNLLNRSRCPRKNLTDLRNCADRGQRGSLG